VGFDGSVAQLSAKSPIDVFSIALPKINSEFSLLLPTADKRTGFLHQQNPNVARIDNGTERIAGEVSRAIVIRPPEELQEASK
jgi:hypothetical protein